MLLQMVAKVHSFFWFYISDVQILYSVFFVTNQSDFPPLHSCFTGDGHGDCSTFEDEQEKVQDGGNDGDDQSKDVAEIKDDLPEQK